MDPGGERTDRDPVGPGGTADAGAGAVMAYRLLTAQHAHLLLDGSSAALTGNRWNPRGSAVIYCATTASLALLELYCHYQERICAGSYVLGELVVPAELIENLDRARLPPRWAALPKTTQRLGADWLRRGTLGLRVPSVVHGNEDNVLLNPASAHFAAVRIHRLAPFRFSAEALSAPRG